MKVVTDMKIFGFTICPTYQQTLYKTWEKVVRGFEQVLFSWESGQLETLSQRVQVAKDIRPEQAVLCCSGAATPWRAQEEGGEASKQLHLQGQTRKIKIE